MPEQKYQSPVACERRTVCDIAALLSNHKGCANPERLALMFDQLQWLLNCLGKESEVFSYSDLQKRLFPWLTIQQIRHAIRELKELDFINSEPEKDGVRYSLGGVVLRQGGVEVGQGRVSNYDTPTLLENKEENLYAETGVSAPQPFASPLLPTAESILTETQKQSAEERKKKVKLAFPSLEELEAQIDGWWQSWELWKTTTLPRQNKSGEISHAALATILADLLEKQNRYNLSAEAMRHGFSAAIGRGVPNVNYVINTAKGYRA